MFDDGNTFGRWHEQRIPPCTLLQCARPLHTARSVRILRFPPCPLPPASFRPRYGLYCDDDEEDEEDEDEEEEEEEKEEEEEEEEEEEA